MESSPNQTTLSNASSYSALDELATLDADASLAFKLAREEAEFDQECQSDAALALLMQQQFDLEYSKQLDDEEQRLHHLAEVTDALDQFHTGADSSGSETKADDDNTKIADDNEVLIELDSNKKSAWDVFEQCEIKQRSRMMGRAGFVLDEEGNMITKHDIPTSSRKNMCKLMELKTDIQTGDAGAQKDDFKITNYVYNRLKEHSKKSSRRATHKLFDKNERENGGLLDEVVACKMNQTTKSIMDGLLVAYKIEKLNGVIGHGKESTVLHATGRDHIDNPGQEVAIKIFKSDLNAAFKTRDTYNKSKCPSYKFDKPRSKHDSLNKWAERGFKNLKLLRKANINCPEAISLKKHILVMTFIGTDAIPSPQLKQAKLTEDQLKSSYEQVLDIMERMYNECGLIHGDLSEYNLLWHNERVYVIDVSQSMFASHPNANRFLYRDCKNILEFYDKAGLSVEHDVKSLFEIICGKNLSENDIDSWSKIEDFPRNERLMEKEKVAEDQLGGQDYLGQMLDAANIASSSEEILSSKVS